MSETKTIQVDFGPGRLRTVTLQAPMRPSLAMDVALLAGSEGKGDKMWAGFAALGFCWRAGLGDPSQVVQFAEVNRDVREYGRRCMDHLCGSGGDWKSLTEACRVAVDLMAANLPDFGIEEAAELEGNSEAGVSG